MAKGIAEGMGDNKRAGRTAAGLFAAAETAQDDAHPVIAIVCGMYLDATEKERPRWPKGNYENRAKGKGGRAVYAGHQTDTE